MPPSTTGTPRRSGWLGRRTGSSPRPPGGRRPDHPYNPTAISKRANPEIPCMRPATAAPIANTHRGRPIVGPTSQETQAASQNYPDYARAAPLHLAPRCRSRWPHAPGQRRRFAAPSNVDQRVVERGGLAHVGQPLRGHLIRVRAVGVSFRHQSDTATTQPGRARSVTRARAPKAPRSLKMRSQSPSLIPGAASSGWMSRCGSFSCRETAAGWQTTN